MIIVGADLREETPEFAKWEYRVFSFVFECLSLRTIIYD